MRAAQAAATLSEIAYLLRHKGDQHRARAFTRVAGMLARENPDLVALRRAGRIETLEGVGAGIAKTLVGYVGSSIGARLDVEHPIARFILTIGFYLFHHAVFALTSRLLLAQQGETYITLPILLASVVNAFIAMGLFPLLDKFRKPS